VIEPFAAHRDRVMVQTHEHMFAPMVREHFAQMRERRRADAAGRRLLHPSVEHDDEPATELDFAADLKRCARQFRSHVIRQIVIAGETHHRNLGSAEHMANPAITLGIVLDEIAGQQNAIGIVAAAARIGDRSLQGRQARDAAKASARLAEEVHIGELYEAKGLHGEAVLSFPGRAHTTSDDIIILVFSCQHLNYRIRGKRVTEVKTFHRFGRGLANVCGPSH
jgi:hypothetical protein